MTTNTTITNEEIAAIFPKVAATMADALGCEVEEVKPQASLIDDLGAEFRTFRRTGLFSHSILEGTF